MNRTPLTTIAPEIFRKRLLIEGFFTREITSETLKAYFEHLTGELGLRTYGEPCGGCAAPAITVASRERRKGDPLGKMHPPDGD